jgi:hypothetical protein
MIAGKHDWPGWPGLLPVALVAWALFSVAAGALR